MIQTNFIYNIEFYLYFILDKISTVSYYIATFICIVQAYKLSK